MDSHGKQFRQPYRFLAGDVCVGAPDGFESSPWAWRSIIHFSYFQETSATTKVLLNFARNRLNKFYNPKMYVPPPKFYQYVPSPAGTSPADF